MKLRIGLSLGIDSDNGRALFDGVQDYVRAQGLDWEWAFLTEEDQVVVDGGDGGHRAHLDALLGRPSAEWMERVAREGIPRVLLWEPLLSPAGREVRVWLDDAQVGRMAARFAWERGFRDVAFVDSLTLPTALRRGRAFLDHARELGLRAHRYADDDHQQADGSAIIQRVAWVRELPDRPLLFFHHDDAASSFVGCAGQLGFAIPDEAAVLGVDNIAKTCEERQPSLSSITPAYRELGQRAALELHRLLHAPRDATWSVRLRPLRVVERQSTAGTNVADPLVSQAVQQMRERLADPLRIGALAAELEVSQATLCRRFDAALGATPRTVLLRLRIDEAKRLLLNTDEPIAGVALRCGFGSRVRFSVAFKEHTGIAPAHYRGKGQSTRFTAITGRPATD